jgi:hypothetical protein
MRLAGGGRPVTHTNQDEELASWIREKRALKQLVSRRIITNKAKDIFFATDLKLSTGWLTSFMQRHAFVLRRRTTTCQKPPKDYADAVASFIVHVEERRRRGGFTEVFAMDETAVWFDCPDNRCIDTRGAKEVTIVTTGHEKMRVTVCLTARSDGKKLLPYVLVKNKRPVGQIIEQFKGKLLINWAGSPWMNDKTTADYLHKIIGGTLFNSKRLIVWDAFGSHKSEATRGVLKKLRLEAAYIPGGCTKFIQAPDVSWNKPFKERIRHYYGLWMTNGDRREYTAAGNPKAPALEVVLDWIARAWQELSKDVIIKSFKACALTTSIDGSEDDQIACFKQCGSIGPSGVETLRQLRAIGMARDGLDDDEDAGLSDEDEQEEAELDGVASDEELELDWPSP